MRLTRFTDYGLRTMIFLAVQKKNVRVTVQDIVDCYDLPRDHVTKVVHRLGILGYLETTRGKHGGIRFAMSPDQVNVGEFVRQVEPTLTPIDCESPPCRLSSNCRLRSALSEASHAFVAVLQKYTLADLVADRNTVRGLLGQCPVPR